MRAYILHRLDYVVRPYHIRQFLMYGGKLDFTMIILKIKENSIRIYTVGVVPNREPDKTFYYGIIKPVILIPFQ